MIAEMTITHLAHNSHVLIHKTNVTIESKILEDTKVIRLEVQSTRASYSQ